jgi:hypothetical protein
MEINLSLRTTATMTTATATVVSFSISVPLFERAQVLSFPTQLLIFKVIIPILFPFFPINNSIFRLINLPQPDLLSPKTT